VQPKGREGQVETVAFQPQNGYVLYVDSVILTSEALKLFPLKGHPLVPHSGFAVCKAEITGLEVDSSGLFWQGKNVCVPTEV